MNQTSLGNSSSAAAPAAPLIIRRTSLRRQILLTALLPLLLIGTLLTVYTSLAATSAVTGALRVRAASIASVTAESVYEDLERVSNPVNRADLNATAAFNLRAIAGGAFVAIAAPEGIVVVAAQAGLGSKPVQLALEQRDPRNRGSQNTGQQSTDQQVFLQVGTEHFVVAQQNVLKYDGTGSLGRVYIGLETTGVGARVWQALLPTLGLLVFALLLAAALGTWLAGGIAKKMLHATETANRISLGDLDGCSAQHANDEIGDLTRALERMRYSLKFMLERSKRK